MRLAKVWISMFLLCVLHLTVIAQDEDTENESVETTLSDAEEQIDDTWLAPRIEDEMTVDPEQNRQWRLGQDKYSAKPKNMWEIGLHGGHFFIDGDIDARFPAGFGIGGHLRKSLNYVLSIRFDGFYGKTSGLEAQPWQHRAQGGGLVENNEQFSGWEGYNTSVSPNSQGWFPAYQTSYFYGAAQLVFNVGNILFHQDRNKWNTYVAIGAGLDHHMTRLDLTDGEGEIYENLIDRTSFNTGNDFNTYAGRRAIRDVLDGIYDGVYETEGFQKEGVFRIGDDFNIFPIFTGSVGVSRKLSKRFNLGLEHQVMLSDNDYLDGIKFRNRLDQSNNVDIAHYTNLRLGMNLGNFSNRTEPLYWINPMGVVFQEIAELKARPQLEIEDEDNDGVLDLLDQEPDTPEGCLVDTKGVTLDSDGDGISDCQDKEPFSPPGYPVDEFGVAAVQDSTHLSEEDVITIIKNNCDACQNKGVGVVRDGVVGSFAGSRNEGEGASSSNTTTGSGSTGVAQNQDTYGTITHSSCGNWFLPMIHFDLDKYALRPEAYASLHHIAYVMKQCPSMCVTAHGHTDVRNTNAYNRVLSYKRAQQAIDHLVANYGIDRSRFKLMYGGEDSPLIPNLKSNHFTSAQEEQFQFINRRVEFRVCNAEDINMGMPEGPDAGTGTPGSSRPGTKYKGYKNSGY